MNKNSLRNEMLTSLTNLKREKYARLSSEINDHFIASDLFKNAGTIGLTISRFPEVNTRQIIEAAWSMGKQVAVPKCLKQTREMDFRLIKSYGDLETVYMNLLEPIISQTKSVYNKEVDVQVVPGVLYSTGGYRIGFGGGYYDRYLKDFDGHTMSLAFECQTNHIVPIEEHDIPVRLIITENGINYCMKSEGNG